MKLRTVRMSAPRPVYLLKKQPVGAQVRVITLGDARIMRFHLQVKPKG